MIPQTLRFFLALPQSLWRIMVRPWTTIGLTLDAIIIAWVGWLFYPQASAPATIRNVILISIDTCRANHLSCYGYKRPTTPNIDAVAQDGAMFKMALTPVPLTTSAHSSMFTGTYPPTHGVHLNTYDRLAGNNATLATILRGAGYQTAAFVAAFPLDSRFGLNQGFDTYDGRFSAEGTQGYFSHRAGEEVNRPALAWLDDHAHQPFFLFLHYYDTHCPYEPHPPYTSACPDDPYGGELGYVDNCIGQILDRLRARGSTTTPWSSSRATTARAWANMASSRTATSSIRARCTCPW